jgi:hypothetical protein
MQRRLLWRSENWSGYSVSPMSVSGHGRIGSLFCSAVRFKFAYPRRDLWVRGRIRGYVLKINAASLLFITATDYDTCVGARCDSCSENYFGNPEVIGGKCVPCNCSNNIDITIPGNCDRNTGKCLQCLYNSDGFNCEYCQAGFYGDALQQNCRSKCTVFFRVNYEKRLLFHFFCVQLAFATYWVPIRNRVPAINSPGNVRVCQTWLARHATSVSRIIGRSPAVPVANRVHVIRTVPYQSNVTRTMDNVLVNRVSVVGSVTSVEITSGAIHVWIDVKVKFSAEFEFLTPVFCAVD